MLKPKAKSSNLPSLQKMIVLHLAESEPKTMNETAKAISKQYRPSWTAFRSLTKKNLIRKTSLLKFHRRQKYPRYWLTDEGIVMALTEGANPDKLLKQYKILYPDAESTHCFLEIASLIHPEVMKIAYSSIRGKDKLGTNEIIMLYLSEPSIAMDDKTAYEFTAILKKYPNQYNAFKNTAQKMINQLSKLITE
jgi:hypothetical protein